ncbi:type II toxin-antitoxin system VapC family toxin [Thalassospira alkalitolerans]|uniref:Twitching motility protein PilT n=1 Tax=Thalassospira alkalitolerans TaxID=1293890 RepID=A0A1Y2LIF6_9PROT|nr:type II toxin-antitoxin system VapC family toxin [Thalassospira alkalitolerans]OSQ50014.1 twitching motility protein PilT [Thalassospira alkalitolerans]|tara:strand:- start:101620 stop:102006 length:387 start_codon:yes stop_codon:yes gene_type:complete
MRVLLDTHALFWWLIDAPQLTPMARQTIVEADTVLISAASMWEVATKVRLGKWPEMAALLPDCENWVSQSGFESLPISFAHARLAGEMDIPHRDPFDRMLIAQSKIEAMPLISNEALFDDFEITRIWS